MKSKTTPYLIGLLLGLVMLGACSDNLMDELPQPVSTFVGTYFPNYAVDDFQFKGNTYIVGLDDGPTVKFNINLVWISVDGNGNTLPSIFINDQLPPGLAEYLQGLTQSDKVYAVSRTDTDYTVSLTDTTLNYDLITGAVSYPDGRSYLAH